MTYELCVVWIFSQIETDGFLSLKMWYNYRGVRSTKGILGRNSGSWNSDACQKHNFGKNSQYVSGSMLREDLKWKKNVYFICVPSNPSTLTCTALSLEITENVAQCPEWILKFLIKLHFRLLNWETFKHPRLLFSIKPMLTQCSLLLSQLTYLYV